ncbi:MAG: peptidase M15 [Bacteroidetes bacterium]|nr:MAG: peptidase M15 [Bacteroidota bacterium]
MMTYYQPEYFKLEEFFPKVFYDKWKYKPDILLGKLNPHALWTLDRMRGIYGAITVNNWLWGGDLNYRGFRPEGCGVGAELSDHKTGDAIDFGVSKYPSQVIRADILANPDKDEFKYITVLERGISWVHLGFRNWDRQTKGILEVYP